LLLPALAGEHQLEQRGVVDGEADVGRGDRAQARLVVLAGAVDRLPQLRSEAREPCLGEGIQQRLAIGEVAAGSAVADADLAGELAQRQLTEALIAQRALGLPQQGGTKVAVVVGTVGQRCLQRTGRCCR
jgi:hypothetical protein